MRTPSPDGSLDTAPATGLGRRGFTGAAQLLAGGKWVVTCPLGHAADAHVGGPQDASARLGDVTFRAVWLVTARGERSLVLPQEVAERVPLTPGQRVLVELLGPEAPEPLEIPADLLDALDRTPAARLAWRKLAPDHRSEFVRLLATNRQADARSARIAEIVRLVAALHGPRAHRRRA